MLPQSCKGELLFHGSFRSAPHETGIIIYPYNIALWPTATREHPGVTKLGIAAL